MNRRDFFKAALGLLGAAALPAAAVDVGGGEWISLDAMRREADMLRENAMLCGNGWYVMIHLDAERDLRRLTARLEWKAAYRRARMELKKMAREVMAEGEFGHVDGFRFIVSERLPT